MAPVTSSQVAAYLPMIEALAPQFTRRRGAEYDDLIQEGMIAVWLTLEVGKTPTEQTVENAMRGWCRKMRRQSQNMLPLEEAASMLDVDVSQ